MSFGTGSQADEMAQAEALPQLDASSLVDGERLEAEGLEVGPVRKNDYRFVSERTLDACTTYEVESISLVASKTG
jgi:hypothetical protein